jgi:Fur family transcriptional regulator, ferric uptake regulator
VSTDWADHTRRELERAGHRAGAARMAVVDCLGRQDCCLSAQEIADELRSEGREVGIASVYRALEVLDDMRLVQRLDAGEGVVRYEPAHPSGAHHHHIVCDRCGRVTAFADERLEHAIDRVSHRLDHAVDAHDVVLRGTCPRCRDRR